MGLSWSDFEELKKSMMDMEVERIRDRAPEQVYVEYLMSQESNVQALSEMIEQFKDTRQHNAMVGAVKARAEIYDKMIAKGQEFGFIKKVPERQEIVAGIMVAELSNDDLRAAIAGELSGLDSLMSAYGTKTIVDVTPGKLHFPTPPKEPPALTPGDTKSHSRNRVHKGRRLKKQQADAS